MTEAGALGAIRARIVAVGSALPEHRRTSGELEDLIADLSPRCRIRRGLIEAMSGVQERRVAAEHENCSDLAATAGLDALGRARVDCKEIDALIFASASQDMVEPATANIVQEKIGTRAPVFDVKNACNSFLNGLQIAEGLIASGSHRKVLVTSGELTSRVVRLDADSNAALRRNFPGFTLGDAGGAAVLEACENGQRGIFHRAFTTVSRFWELATIPGGGTMHPRGEEWTYIRGDGTALRDAFQVVGPALIEQALRATGTTFADFARILVHQVSMPFLHDFIERTKIPLERIELTLPHLGNMASASLPVAYAQAEARGALVPGDKVLWVGMASGISLGVIMTEV